MLTDNLIIVIAIMGFVAILALILMIVAARHDHEIAAAPRYRTLDVLDEEIELKTNIKSLVLFKQEIFLTLVTKK